MFGVWWVTGWDALLLTIATQLLQMLRQLTPMVRFDGYHVLADVTGVPDLYHRIKPTLLGLLPSRWDDPASKVLKPWARAVVTAWVLLVVPLLLAALVLMTLALPRVLGTAVASLDRQWQMMGEQFAAGDVLAVMVRVLSGLAIVLPVLGSGYILARVVRQIVAGTWRATRGRPGRRTVAGVVAAAIIAGLGWAWWPQPGAYRPIQPDERGTVQDAVPGAPATHPATEWQGGRSGTAQAIWPQGSVLPTADSPGLALVLVPRTGVLGTATATSTPTLSPSTSSPSSATVPDGSPAPTWVFPFSRPAAPEAGDNQALAINTLDGSTVYDVAFALVWAVGDRVLNTNEAYAFASCTGCRTVSVGFQVVLVLGQANVVVPQNLAGTINYNCVRCVTYALATQLVVRLSGPLSEQGDADLAALWEEIRASGKSIEGVPVSELQSRLTDYEGRILDIIRRDPSATPAGDSQAPADEPSASPTRHRDANRIGNRDAERDRVEHRSEWLHREPDVRADRHGLAVRIGNRDTVEHRGGQLDPEHNARADLLAVNQHVSLPAVHQHVPLRDHESIRMSCRWDDLLSGSTRQGGQSPMSRNTFRRGACVPSTRQAGLEGIRVHDLRPRPRCRAIPATGDGRVPISCPHGERRSR